MPVKKLSDLPQKISSDNGDGFVITSVTGQDMRVPFQNLRENLSIDDIENSIQTLEDGQTRGFIGYTDKATLDADTTQESGTVALVTNDPTASNNGYYRWDGSAWVKRDEFYQNNLIADQTSEAVTGRAVGDFVRSPYKITGFSLNGLYLSGDTVFTESQNWGSQKVPVKSTDRIDYNVYSNSSANIITYFNSSDTIIGTVTGEDPAPAALNTGTSYAPSGTSYAIVTSFIDGVTGYFFSLYANPSEALKADSVPIFENLFIDESGFYSSVDDTFTEAQNWGTDKFKVNEGDRVEYNVFSNENANIVTFFDTDGDIISSSAGTGSSANLQDGGVLVPEGATEAAVTSFKNGVSGYFYRKVRSVGKFLDEYVRTPIKHDYFPDTGFYSSTNVFTESIAWYNRTIYLKEGDSVKYKLYAHDGVNILVFFDKDDNIIKSVQGQNAAPANLNEGEVTAPHKSHKVVVTCFLDNYETNLYAKVYERKIKEEVTSVEAEKINPFEADILLFLHFGQSNSEAQQAIAFSDPQQDALMANTGVLNQSLSPGTITSFKQLHEQTNETEATGSWKMLKKTFKENGYELKDKRFLFFNGAIGGTTITDLVDGQGLTNILSGIAQIQNVCDGLGLTMNVLGLSYDQGESDLSDRSANSIQDGDTWKAKLITDVYNAINDKAQLETGQTNDLMFFMSQSASCSMYDQDFDSAWNYLSVPNAQRELAEDNANFSWVAPHHIFDIVTPENIHLTAKSQKLKGAYLGYAMYKRFFEKINWAPIKIESTSITTADANNPAAFVEIQFKASTLPLKFDTDWVQEAENMGFSVVKPDNTQIATSVEVVYDKVFVYCSENPTGAKLRYGAVGSPASSNIGGVVGISGRWRGARGNLRDSQGDHVKFNIDGSEISLHNWCPLFEIQL